MEALMWAVVAVLCTFLLLASIWGLFVGLFTLVSNQELQRCRRCGRYGLAPPGKFHARSCPPVVARSDQRLGLSGHLRHRISEFGLRWALGVDR
ncbi:MAG: hypothetical protein J2P58_04865 [Acidimicrobiaceae bacterium]|nr:hypothetical protein [Acidimicrobiaceae bacterium]MBO0746827.1 hypothetical protein [Acidimicrobiaceae bacterium]